VAIYCLATILMLDLNIPVVPSVVPILMAMEHRIKEDA